MGALPARLRFQAAQATIEAHRNFVVVAFLEEDPAVLEGPAKSAWVVIVPDCGLAPGLSNLVVGRAVAGRKRDRICVEVGSVAQDPSRPCGYVVT